MKTLDTELPGPRYPAALQTARWLTRRPLRYMEQLAARYGPTVRLRVLGPRFSGDRTRRPLIPRSIVLLSEPSHLREIIARTGTELLGGQPNAFIEWHAGSDSVVVLDGPSHREERGRLQTTLTSAHLTRYDELAKRAMQDALAEWPDRGTVPLGQLVRRAALDMGVVTLFGPLDRARLRRIGHLVETGAASTAVDPAVMVMPLLHRDYGRWSPGGRVRRVFSEFDEIVRGALSRTPSGGHMLAALRDHVSGDAGSAGAMARTLQRARTMMSALKVTAVAAPWLCHRVFSHPEALDRATAVARDGETEAVDGTGYLLAACQETLRMTPPFLGGMRRVAVPTTFGGIEWQAGTFILPATWTTHRRPDLYPEPERFRPERFLGCSYLPHEYAPFGTGNRRCPGEQITLRHLVIVLAELLRAFDVAPARAWSNRERREHTMVFPEDLLPATITRRQA